MGWIPTLRAWATCTRHPEAVFELSDMRIWSTPWAAIRSYQSSSIDWGVIWKAAR